MDDDRRTSFSLRRWSRRKLEAARRRDDVPASRQGLDAASPAPKTPPANDTVTAGSVVPSGVPDARSPSTDAQLAAGTESVASLPPLDSLTIDSDFSPFMQAGVDETVKREALRKLVRHPRFNVMDGLDVYIDDYSKPSPLEPALARALVQARYVFDPPKTRITAEGTVEDVPEPTEPEREDVADEAPAAATDASPSVASLEAPRGDQPNAERQGTQATSAGKPVE